jgi:TonB family protein
MSRLILAAAVVVAIGVAAPASAQGGDTFQTIRDWDTDSAKTESTLDTLRLLEGIIWTPRAYADFVLRFEYRPLTPTGGGTLLLRSNIDGDRTIHSYEAALNGSPERGRLDGARQVLHELRFVPSAPIADTTQWVAAEVRAESDRLSVLLDGVTLATADRAEGLFGTIGFKAGAGGVELRGMRIAALSTEPAAIGVGLPRVGDPDITPPKPTRRASPRYTAAAMRAKAFGVAKLEFVIEADGSVGAVRVIDVPHPDLALSSVACVREWRFRPATRDGVPVAVVATMELAFNLKR